MRDSEVVLSYSRILSSNPG